MFFDVCMFNVCNDRKDRFSPYAFLHLFWDLPWVLLLHNTYHKSEVKAPLYDFLQSVGSYLKQECCWELTMIAILGSPHMLFCVFAQIFLECCYYITIITSLESRLTCPMLFYVFTQIFLECCYYISLITSLESRLTFHMLFFNVFAQIYLQCCCEVTMVALEWSETCCFNSRRVCMGFLKERFQRIFFTTSNYCVGQRKEGSLSN